MPCSPSYDAATHRGYSTPAVAIGPDGNFHLFHDVVFDPMGFEQVAISRAYSSDGINFTEGGIDIISRGDATWIDYEVRAPSPLFDGDQLKLYFAGNRDLATVGPTGFESGVGLVTGTTTCP